MFLNITLLMLLLLLLLLKAIVVVFVVLLMMMLLLLLILFNFFIPSLIFLHLNMILSTRLLVFIFFIFGGWSWIG